MDNPIFEVFYLADAQVLLLIMDNHQKIYIIIFISKNKRCFNKEILINGLLKYWWKKFTHKIQEVL